MHRKLTNLTLFPCLICGVDSREIKTFLFLFIGGLALASVCVILWAFGTRRFLFSEEKASFAIEAEEKKG